MKLSRDWGFKIETLQKPPSANFSLMQRIRESLKGNTGPIIARPDSAIRSETKPTMIPKGRSTQTTDSINASQRTRSHTPARIRSVFPGIHDKDSTTSIGNHSAFKSDFISDLQSITQDQTYVEANSPVKIIASRPSSPERLSREFQSTPQSQNMNDTLSNQNSILPNLKMTSNKMDLSLSERRNENAPSFNNTIPVCSTRVIITNQQKGPVDLDFFSHENTTPIERSNSNNQAILRKNSSFDDEGKRKWGKLSRVMRSIMLLKRQETKPIGDEKDINIEIDSYNMRKWKNPNLKEIDLANREHSKDAFELVRRVQAFCECVTVGSQSHLEIMKRILADDPKKYIFESDDPMHLINKKNNFGHSPMYIAAKNGHLNVVRFLVDNKANHNILSQVSQSIKELESPLEVAVRWSHEGVVNFMLENCQFDYKVVKKCLKLSSSPIIKKSIQTYIDRRYRRKSVGVSCLKK